MTQYVYDLETYKHIFTFAFKAPANGDEGVFEVSRRRNDWPKILDFLKSLKNNDDVMVGFNNIGFDYPVLHEMRKELKRNSSFEDILTVSFDFSQRIIFSEFEDRFSFTIWDNQRYVPQMDLMKIHHFDNPAKATSLKLLEFNMRSHDIRDLPFPVKAELTDDEMDELISYNKHDVNETCKFLELSEDMISFRESLTEKYDRDFSNHNDTKIGSDYFIMDLEKELGEDICYTKDENGKRKIQQTKRPIINIEEVIFDYVQFKRPEFNAILNWFKEQTLTAARGTKGVFTDLNNLQLGEVAEYAVTHTKKKKFKNGYDLKEAQAFETIYPAGEPVPVALKSGKESWWWQWQEAEALNVQVDGLQYIYGTGGLHASVESQTVREDDEYMILDQDVTSFYPSLAIENELFPKHIGKKFCEIYADMKKQRTSFAKGTAENAMLKLALNGTYGNSNNTFSPFYDPQFTMSITVNGQLLLCMLAEELITIPDLIIIQVNTDGVTSKFKRKDLDKVRNIASQWEKVTSLQLEEAEYKAMYIRDVNNYVAEYTNGKVKRKGTYAYNRLDQAEMPWNKDHSAFVIRKAAEAYLLHDTNIERYIKEHRDPFDFYLRAKVPRSSKLVLRTDGEEVPLQNICRYYLSTTGGKLVKIMPPTEKKPDKWREFAIGGNWLVTPCNHVDGLMPDDIDYQYYINEALKLVQPLEEV